MERKILSSSNVSTQCFEEDFLSDSIKRVGFLTVRYYKDANGISLEIENDKGKKLFEKSLTSDQYNDRPYDYTNNFVEYDWAIGLAGYTR